MIKENHFITLNWPIFSLSKFFSYWTYTKVIRAKAQDLTKQKRKSASRSNFVHARACMRVCHGFFYVTNIKFAYKIRWRLGNYMHSCALHIRLKAIKLDIKWENIDFTTQANAQKKTHCTIAYTHIFFCIVNVCNTLSILKARSHRHIWLMQTRNKMKSVRFECFS